MAPAAFCPYRFPGLISHAGRLPGAGQSVPPVYRPTALGLAQAKLSAPPVYRPDTPTVSAMLLDPRAGLRPGVVQPPGPSCVQPQAVALVVAAPVRFVPYGASNFGHGAVVQGKKAHAERYIKTKDLRHYGEEAIAVNATKIDIKKFVDDPRNSSTDRERLLASWNSGLASNHRIATPADLVRRPVRARPIASFSGYDSDDDKNLDVEDFFKGKAKRTLVRRDDRDIEAHQLDFRDSVRYGRYLAKNSKIKRSNPFVTEVGPLHIEFASPGTEDIYAFPLRKKRKLNSDEFEANKFEREGGTKEFSYVNLVKHMEEDHKKEEDRYTAVKNVFDYMDGIYDGTFSRSQSELAGAIACDGMKGVAGMCHYIDKARTHLESEDFSLGTMFTGNKPAYRPAAEKGRSKATRRTAKIKKQRALAKASQLQAPPQEGFKFEPPNPGLL